MQNPFPLHDCRVRVYARYRYVYLGCYKDVKPFEEKALHDFGGYIPNRLTVDYCFQSCNDSDGGKAYAYFGLSAPFCFCGRSDADYARYGPLSENRCSGTCPGDREQKCGSDESIRVFRRNDTLCNTMPSLANGEVDQNGVVARFRCNPGYRLLGEEFLTCGYNYNTAQHVWNGMSPVCNTAIVTDTPKLPTRAQRVPSTTPKVTMQKRTSTTHPIKTETTTQVIVHSTTKGQGVIPTTTKKRNELNTKASTRTSSKPTLTDPVQRSTKQRTQTESLKESGTPKLFTSSASLVMMSISTSLLLLKIFQ
ncbi:hypothetical protein BSL78_22192 [Apostichopus japonicus]|uniref:Uncharacterized protein n=1 Tax=Stichopus japonicus TaxID=307972 RepID=A0A2G8JYZ5_STIJA|nr:hypothetical protein BSL78_22192 [Apostichopus japonicus]